MHKGSGEIFSVSQLNSQAKSILEGSFGLLWIEGEISNLAQPASGHLYFSLKDAKAQVRCAMFRGRNNLLRFRPENGMQVMIYARVSLYEGRGEFQLIVDRMEPAGEGALQLAFDQLKQKLDQEGLFDTDRKKPLPSFPNRVGVVTSASGAALKDILSVLERRFPAMQIIVYPSLVQGDSAAHEIARMIYVANDRAECDVLIIGRGGGSLEDLWAFNEEVVARAIVDSHLPIISAVGHEIDYTIADLVADVRAATPSAAAELISPDQQELKQQIDATQSWMEDHARGQLRRLQESLNWLEKRLIDPGRRLEALAQRLDDQTHRLRVAMQSGLDRRRLGLGDQTARLKRYHPGQIIAANLERCRQQRIRLQSAIQWRLEKVNNQLADRGRALQMVSPLATLGRGYAIIQLQPKHSVEKGIIRSAVQLKSGDKIRARLAKGSIECTVDQVNNESLEGDSK